jgi:chemotaxis protein methyltransferase CheR
MDKNVVISDEELSSISNAVHSRYGIDFTQYEPSSLKRRIVRIIHKYEIDGVFGLWQKLLYELVWANV